MMIFSTCITKDRIQLKAIFLNILQFPRVAMSRVSYIVIGQSFFLIFRRGERQVVPVTRKTKKYKCYQTRSMMDWWWLNHLGLYIHLFIANAQISIEFHQTSHNSSFSKLTVQAHSMIVLGFLIHMFRYRLNIIQFYALCSALMNK